MTTMRQALAAKDEAKKLLAKTSGIAGIGVTWSRDGEPRVRVNVEESMPPSERRKIPARIGGVAIDVQPVGRLVFHSAGT